MPVTHEVASSSLVVPAIKREPFMGSFLMAECQWRETLLRVEDFDKSGVSDKLKL